MSTNAQYYDFVKRNLEYTKICTKKCKVLENTADDYLSKNDSDCLGLKTVTISLFDIFY